jgi:formate dehydrogenase subunit gamma
MEFVRRAINPWGQEVLIGVAWDLLWVAAIAGAAFIVAHAVYRLLFVSGSAASTGAPGQSDTSLPERILRHTTAARLFHWLMSIAMFTLLITAFFPVLGLRFPWVTIHWTAGVGLLLLVVYHIVHAVFWQDLRSMWFGRREIREGLKQIRGFFTRRAASERVGKYPLDHRLYHHTIAAVSVAAITTGLLMMVRVDTPFWERNPYLLSDSIWGFVYVAHGLSGVALITLVMAHVYFAVRPEKWWITVSMINGWIGREEYLAHHDPTKWVVMPASPRSAAGVRGAADLPEGVPRAKQPST